MRIDSCASWWYGRLTFVVLVGACVVVGSLAVAPDRAEAGSLVIPAWSFVRGNAQVYADPHRYADAGPLVGSGPEQSWGWRVQYEVEVPVTGTYTLQVCYASAEARPIEVYVNDLRLTKCCIGVTYGAASAGQEPELTFNGSGAKWECVRNYFENPQNVSLKKGKNTILFTRRAPLPHLVALRLETEEEFPVDWQPPKYVVQDLESIPAEHRAAFASGTVSAAIAQLPIEDTTRVQAAGSWEIPAWTFDRGNVRVYASPDEYADAGPLVGDGPQSPGEGSVEGAVEYDIEFPVDAEYTLYVRYAAAAARPVDVYLDGRKLGKCCLDITFGSAPFENPIRFTSNSSGALKKWEGIRTGGKVLAVPVTKGKHTLKFTRRGPLPNLMTLRLDSSVSFPEGWQPPERKMRHLGRVPARERTAFLPPDAVNVGALRLAIQDMIENLAQQYPDGQQYLDQLATLEARQRAAEDGTPEQQQEIEDALAALRRRAMLAHPALKFDKLLFLKRAPNNYGHTYADQSANSMGGNLCILSPVTADGEVTTLVPELEGGLFDRFDLSFDAKRVVFGYKREDGAFRIYEIEIDPAAGKMVSGSLRQLTFGCENEAEALACNAAQGRSTDRGFNDMDPCYLPDGRILFTSTRSMRNVFCAGSTVTTLYIMDADGSNVRCLSAGPINELAPAVLDDGRVIYTRWEYVDKGLGNGASLWTVRLDGSGSDHVFKNNTVRPAGMSNARSIPDSQQLVTIGGTHHNTAIGSVVLVDARRSRRGTEAMTCLTPEMGYACMSWATTKFGFFMDPFPFSEKFFLTAHSPGHKTGGAQQGYGIYVLDAWGNRAELVGDAELNCYEPIPLHPRRKPSKIAALAAKSQPAAATGDEKMGSLFVQDVYQGMTGIERGRVKYLRVMGVLPWPWDEMGMQNVGADVHRKKVYGVVKVHEDGSAHFKVPADENVFFHALDENFMALQQMPTFINLMPGEQRSCIGCHEARREAPNTASARPLAMDGPPQMITPQPGDAGPRMVDFAADVQPTLDRHCVGCHGGEQPEAALNLNGALTGNYSRSYETLVHWGLVAYADCRYGRANFRAVPPLTHGSHRSKLAEQIRRDPCKGGLSREEYIKIVTWIDANVPYYGTYRGKRELRDKDDPSFRALPLAGK